MDETQPLPNEISKTLKELGPWHFKIEIMPGVWTHHYNLSLYQDPDKKNVAIANPQELTLLFRRLFPEGLHGMSFLDVGCNGGGYCFLAHDLGAKSVCGFDVREHWIKQANFIQKIKYPGTATIKFFPQDVREFRQTNIKYDITLFKGIFYHLPDPIGDLNQICNVTKRIIIVDTASHSNIPERCLISIRETKTGIMSGVHALAWLPGGPEALRPILEWSGFPYMRVVSWKRNDPGGSKDWGRFRIVAARIEADLENYDASQSL